MLVVVWSTNLYNFMDGADGLAGGMTLIGFARLRRRRMERGRNPRLVRSLDQRHCGSLFAA